jgi:hypothetical protein
MLATMKLVMLGGVAGSNGQPLPNIPQSNTPDADTTEG